MGVGDNPTILVLIPIYPPKLDTQMMGVALVKMFHVISTAPKNPQHGRGSAHELATGHIRGNPIQSLSFCSSTVWLRCSVRGCQLEARQVKCNLQLPKQGFQDVARLPHHHPCMDNPLTIK